MNKGSLHNTDGLDGLRDEAMTKTTVHDKPPDLDESMVSRPANQSLVA